MKRLLLITMVPGLLFVAMAQGMLLSQASATATSERVQQFQQNRKLIERLVQGGVDLAGEDDCVKRVEYCSKLTEFLAAEMQQARTDKDTARFQELSRHLRTLQHGMADNVKALPAPDDKIPALERYLMGATKPLEDQLQQGTDKEKLQGVREGQAEIEKALKDRKSRSGKPDRSGSGSGKNDNRIKD